jgi:hypothetical protein
VKSRRLLCWPKVLKSSNKADIIRKRFLSS